MSDLEETRKNLSMAKKLIDQVSELESQLQFLILSNSSFEERERLRGEIKQKKAQVKNLRSLSNLRG